MKNMLGLLAIFVLVMVQLTACGGGKSGSDGGGASAGSQPAKQEQSQGEAKQNVTLKFSIWGNDTHKQMYEEMIAAFRETHPNINVEVMTIPFAEYQQKLTIMQASKTAPDVVWLAERMIPQFITAGHLLDISFLKDDADYKFDDIFPSTLDLVTKDGGIYGIPFSTPPSMLYYNKTLFEAKGLPTPKELYLQGKWNFDEFLKAAKALTDSAQGIYGTNFVRSGGWNNWPDVLQTVFNAYGAELFSEDGTAFMMNSPEGEQALQFFADMMFKDEIHPKPGDQTTFDTGKIAMQKELFSYMGKAKAITDFEWDIAPLPAGPYGPGTTIGYAAYTIMKDTKHPEEAAEFLKFITNPDNMMTTSQFFVPSRKSILESEAFLQQGPSAESVKLAVIDQMEGAKSLPSHVNWQNIDTTMQTVLDYLYSQSLSVKEVLAKAEAEIAPLLKS
jgi:multiple sugar transport system substrate-binding protein